MISYIIIRKLKFTPTRLNKRQKPAKTGSSQLKSPFLSAKKPFSHVLEPEFVSIQNICSGNRDAVLSYPINGLNTSFCQCESGDINGRFKNGAGKGAAGSPIQNNNPPLLTVSATFTRSILPRFRTLAPIYSAQSRVARIYGKKIARL